MSYFKEISNYTTYSGADADFHFMYNANSGGGQAFLGGRYSDAEGNLVSPESLNGKNSVFKITYADKSGTTKDIVLRDPKAKYDIKPRGNGSTSMKLGIGNDREAPSRIISSFFMLPPTCGVKMPANLDLSVLSTSNYWLLSMWLECDTNTGGSDDVYLIPKDYVFCGGINKDSGTDVGRYFSLDSNKRILDIIQLAGTADTLLPDSISPNVSLFADIYLGNREYSYDECSQAIKELMTQLASLYPERFSGISDPLPCLLEIAQEQHDNDILGKEVGRATGGENIILYGVPGSGKSWTIEHEYCEDKTRMERLVFHPDYMYSDFIGQILPVVREDKVRYEFSPGPFTKLLEKAYHDPVHHYYLIVEEINRGNAPAIFGEVFQLLDRITEPDQEFPVGTSEYEITNSNIAQIVYKDPERKVRIPSNFSIIGTMNTSDQNVFTLDTAFQRRWIMRMIQNSFEPHRFANHSILDTTVSWKAFCYAINDEVLRRNNVTSSEDKRLGAYFITAADLVWHTEEDTITDHTSRAWIDARHSNARFAEKVLKYLWDDAFKFSHPEVFNIGTYKSLELVIDHFCNARGDDRFGVFNDNLLNQIMDEARANPADNVPAQTVQDDTGDQENGTPQ